MNSTSFDIAAPDQIIKPGPKLSEVCRNCKGLQLVLVEEFGVAGEKEGHRTKALFKKGDDPNVVPFLFPENREANIQGAITTLRNQAHCKL